MMQDAAGCPPSQDRDIRRDVEIFFELSQTLALAANEQQALLSISGYDLDQLRADPDVALELDEPKLVRRLSYAIPILRRMVASTHS